MIIEEKQFEIWQSVMNLKSRLRPDSNLAGFPKLWDIWTAVLNRFGHR